MEDLFTQWGNRWISPSNSRQRVNQHFSVSNDFSGIKDPLQRLSKTDRVYGRGFLQDVRRGDDIDRVSISYVTIYRNRAPRQGVATPCLQSHEPVRTRRKRKCFRTCPIADSCRLLSSAGKHPGTVFNQHPLPGHACCGRRSNGPSCRAVLSHLTLLG